MHTLKYGLLVLPTLLLLTACSDPSEGVHKSQTSAPQNTQAPSAAGAVFTLRSESTIDFEGSKVTGSHKGGFKSFAGTITVSDGKVVGNPEIKIAMASTWSDNDRLTGHLKSADFFDAAQHPVSTFTVTKIEPQGDKQQITGNLSLHGVTKSIQFPADLKITPTGLTLKAEFAINRRDFNINYPGKPNDLIRDNVVLRLDVKATPGPTRPQDALSL